MYAARLRKSAGFSSVRNTRPGAAAASGAPGSARSVVVIVVLLDPESPQARLTAAAGPGSSGEAAERSAAGRSQRRGLRPVIPGGRIAGPAGRTGQRQGQPGRDTDVPRRRNRPQHLVAGMDLSLHADLLLVVTGRPGRGRTGRRVRGQSAAARRAGAGPAGSAATRQVRCWRGWPCRTVIHTLAGRAR